MVIDVPPVKAYAVSHQTHRKGQPVSRTKTQGRPAWVPSPWMEWKISVTVSCPDVTAEVYPAGCVPEGA